MPWLPHGMPPQKRLLDLTVAVIGVLILSPLFLLTALLVWVLLGWPVFFVQTRPGHLEKPYRIIKFRSMNDRRDEEGRLLPDARRLTRFGSFLRAASLDEWPELINVLRGEMSLVGPRPLLMQYLDRYTPEQRRRHAVLPGITGWAQVNGRNRLTWEQKFDLDVWYVDHWTFRLDIRILWMTLGVVIRRLGINQPGQATAEEFQGSRKDR